MTATLAIDVGGSKILAALVEGDRVLDRVEVATDRDGGAEAWIGQMADLAHRFAGRFGRFGVTVTGIVHDGRWSALNPATLPVPPAFPLGDRLQAATGHRPVLANDAHAAAWGEYLHGAGQSRDMVFLTVSTGIGGGVVSGGRLLTGATGLSGHVGQLLPPDGRTLFEDRASGRWITRAASGAGHATDARGVFAAAEAGAVWAESILAAAAGRIAVLCRNLRLLFDPSVVVIGGGVGLATGFIDRVDAALDEYPPLFRPTLARAALGADAGAIGIAALANQTGST